MLLNGYDHVSVCNRTLEEMATSLEEHGKNLHVYGLPEPDTHGTEVLFEMRRWAHLLHSMGEKCDDAFSKFNSQQREIFGHLTALFLKTDLYRALYMDQRELERCFSSMHAAIDRGHGKKLCLPQPRQVSQHNSCREVGLHTPLSKYVFFTPVGFTL